MPEGSEHVWTVRKSTKRLKLSCNDVPIFNYEFSKSPKGDDCVQRWSTYAVKFQFHVEDEVADFYRANPNFGKFEVL